MAAWQEFLSGKPEVCAGEICATGTRIPATVILDNLAEVRFKLDENLPVESAADLRAMGTTPTQSPMRDCAVRRIRLS